VKVKLSVLSEEIDSRSNVASGTVESFTGVKHRVPRFSQSAHTCFLKDRSLLSSDRQFESLPSRRSHNSLWQLSNSRDAVSCSCRRRPRFTDFLPCASSSADGWISISKRYVSKKSSKGSQTSRPMNVDARAESRMFNSECQSERPSFDHLVRMYMRRTARAYSCTMLTAGSISVASCSKRRRSWKGLAWLKMMLRSCAPAAAFLPLRSGVLDLAEVLVREAMLCEFEFEFEFEFVDCDCEVDVCGVKAVLCSLISFHKSPTQITNALMSLGLRSWRLTNRRPFDVSPCSYTYCLASHPRDLQPCQPSVAGGGSQPLNRISDLISPIVQVRPE
jgi:hypothetical protein